MNLASVRIDAAEQFRSSGAAQLVVNIGRRDRGFSSGYYDLIQASYEIAHGIESRDRGELVMAHPDGAVIIQIRARRRRQLILWMAAKGRITHIKIFGSAVR
jgi:hypothetical protein